MRAKPDAAGRTPPERTQDQEVTSARKPRADAQRNRELLEDAAKAAFAQSGANVSLEEIARRAGVGIGTLYRHFPTRDAMIEAVYRREVQQLADSATRLAGTAAPADALDLWMRLFVDYIATKKVLAAAFGSVVGGASERHASSGAQITEALTLLMGRAVASGEIRSDVAPGDVLRALVGLTYGAMDPDWEQSARRLIDVLMGGLRTKPESAR